VFLRLKFLVVRDANVAKNEKYAKTAKKNKF